MTTDGERVKLASVGGMTTPPSGPPGRALSADHPDPQTTLPAEPENPISRLAHGEVTCMLDPQSIFVLR